MTLAELEAAKETAWLEHNRVQQHLPDCEHVRAWRAEAERARREHLAALRRYDEAAAEAGLYGQAAAAPEPEPAPVPEVPAGDEQEALFSLGHLTGQEAA